MKQILIVNN